ncbi:hypothetical protein SEA_ALLEB_74 [Microbacterium phage Alleb]|nr:hypothetical protein SEA_ALLEB_74 [Microbacterium phage Alleb]
MSYNGKPIRPPDFPPAKHRPRPRATPEEKSRALELWSKLGEKTAVMRVLARETGHRRDITVITKWIREGEKK